MTCHMALCILTELLICLVQNWEKKQLLENVTIYRTDEIGNERENWNCGEQRTGTTAFRCFTIRVR